MEQKYIARSVFVDLLESSARKSKFNSVKHALLEYTGYGRLGSAVEVDDIGHIFSTLNADITSLCIANDFSPTTKADMLAELNEWHTAALNLFKTDVDLAGSDSQLQAEFDSMKREYQQLSEKYNILFAELTALKNQNLRQELLKTPLIQPNNHVACDIRGDYIEPSTDPASLGYLVFLSPFDADLASAFLAVRQMLLNHPGAMPANSNGVVVHFKNGLTSGSLFGIEYMSAIHAETAWEKIPSIYKARFLDFFSHSLETDQ